MKKDTIQQRNRKLTARLNSSSSFTTPPPSTTTETFSNKSKKDNKYNNFNNNNNNNDFTPFESFDTAIGGNFLPQQCIGFLNNNTDVIQQQQQTTAQNINVHHFHHVAPVHDQTTALLFEKSSTVGNILPQFDQKPTWSAFSSTNSNNSANSLLLPSTNPYSNSNYANGSGAYGQWSLFSTAPLQQNQQTITNSIKDKKNLSNSYFYKQN